MRWMAAVLVLVAGGCARDHQEAWREMEGQQRVHEMLEWQQMHDMPPVPTAASCRAAPVGERPLYLCLADAHADAACKRPPDSDARPYTLCLAETFDADVEAELARQLAAATARAGTSGAALAAEQRAWAHDWDRACREETRPAPVPEQARADLTCRARFAADRVAVLAAR